VACGRSQADGRTRRRRWSPPTPSWITVPTTAAYLPRQRRSLRRCGRRHNRLPRGRGWRVVLEPREPGARTDVRGTDSAGPHLPARAGAGRPWSHCSCCATSADTRSRAVSLVGAGQRGWRR
jgi:hypothetical protein